MYRRGRIEFGENRADRPHPELAGARQLGAFAAVEPLEREALDPAIRKIAAASSRAGSAPTPELGQRAASTSRKRTFIAPMIAADLGIDDRLRAEVEVDALDPLVGVDDLEDRLDDRPGKLLDVVDAGDRRPRRLGDQRR